MTDFAQQLQQARERTGLSQAKLAKKLGVSDRTLQEWEQGRRTPTDYTQASILAKAAALATSTPAKS